MKCPNCNFKMMKRTPDQERWQWECDRCGRYIEIEESD